MSAVSIVSIAIGIFLIVLRGPLAFAPVAYARLLRRWLEKNWVVRSLGAGFLLLGAAGIWATEPVYDWLGQVLAVVSWLMLLGSLLLLASPSAFRRLVGSVLDALDDGATLRLLGLLNIGFGAILIWAGVTRET